MLSLELNPALDAACIQSRFAETNRVQIRNFLTDWCAERLARTLEEQHDWNLVTTHGGRHIDLDYRGMEARPQADKDRLQAIVHEQARADFGYLFCNVPLYDLAHREKLQELALLEVYRFLNSSPAIEFVRSVTGAEDISFADSQATKYLPGHFLTTHDDAVQGKNRRAAYVLSMTRDWRPDWGGLLQFFGDDGRFEEAFIPGFNTLSIFAVPQQHSVSVVAPFAGAPRYSITGWFRAGEDPGPG